MISPDTIARIKERTDIVGLIGEVVRLQRKGRSFVGLCPFHKEKSPSFTVNAERGFFHCFGCKESGSAVDFTMKLHGLTFPEAVRELAERAGIQVEETRSSAEEREATAARRLKDDLYAVNQLAATYYARALRPGSEGHPLSRYARAELERRGLPWTEGTGLVADALQAFRVGYAPLAWDGLATYLKQQGVSPLVAEQAGLLLPRSTGSGHYDRFRHRLMFAVVDVMGRIVAWSGRALEDPPESELPPGAPRPDPEAKPAKYINSPESPIYSKGEQLFGLHQARSGIREQGEALMVEGNFDVLALHARGLTHVVAPLGTAFTEAQAKLLKRFAPRVVLLFDGDAAGRKATRASRAPCRQGGLDAKVASLPAGRDPDELVRAEGLEAIQHLVRSARGLLEHLIDEALDEEGFGSATLSERLARIRAVVKLLQEEDDPSLRGLAKHYADRLSSKLVVQGSSPTDLRQLEGMLEEAFSHGGRAPAEDSGEAATSGESSRKDPIGFAILGALLDFPELLEDPEVQADLDVLEGDAALCVALLQSSRDGEGNVRQAAEVLARFPSAIHSFAAGRLASPAFESAEVAKGELRDNAQKLKKNALRRANAAVLGQLQRGGAPADTASEDALLLEMAQRSKKKLGLLK